VQGWPAILTPGCLEAPAIAARASARRTPESFASICPAQRRLGAAQAQSKRGQDQVVPVPRHQARRRHGTEHLLAPQQGDDGKDPSAKAQEGKEMGDYAQKLGAVNPLWHH